MLKKINDHKFKILVSILFGLIGFFINLLDLQLIQIQEFKISILIGLLFPLIIALAWGWKYGLLSALAGGCQTLWYLWYTDGYGFIYAVPVFTLWIVWHGFWSDHRRKYGNLWYNYLYIIEIPFRIVIELGFYTLFRLLVSFNPPFWDDTITGNFVSISWVNTVVVKHFVTAYLLLLVAHIVLQNSYVRKFFRLKKRPAERIRSRIISISVGLGLCFWLLESLIDFLIYNSPHKDFLSIAILHPDQHNILIRFLFFILILIAGLIISKIIKEREILKLKTAHINNILKSIRNVNQAINKQKDEKKLLKEICMLMIQDRGFENCLILKKETYSDYYMKYQDLDPEKQIDKSELPNCLKLLEDSKDIFILKEDKHICEKCLLFSYHKNKIRLIAKIKHENLFYGYIILTVSSDYLDLEKEKFYYLEIIDDIGYGLNAIQLNKEKKQQQKELAEKKKQLQLVLDTVPNIIFYKNKKHRNILANKALANYLNMTVEEIEGKKTEELFPKDEARKMDDDDDDIMTRGISKFNIIEDFTIDGKKHWSKTHKVPLKNDENEIIGVLGVVEDITELKQAQDKLKKNERDLRITLNSIGDGVISTDAKGRITKMNPIAENMTGWNLEDAKGKPLEKVFKIINSFTEEPVTNPVKKVMATKDIIGLANHTTLISKENKKYHIADSAAPIIDFKGKIHGVVLVFQDVTEKYRKNQIIKANEKRFRTLIEQSPEIIILHNINGKIIDFNEKAVKKLGYDREDFKKIKISDIAPEYGLSKLNSTTIESNNTLRYESHLITKTSRRIPVEISVSSIQLDKELFYLAILGDITERKNYEKKLLDKNKQLDMALSGGDLGTWNWYPQENDKVIYDERWLKILGYSMDELDQKFDTFENLLHPDDKQKTMDAIADHLNRKNNKFEMEFRLRHKSGKWIWTNSRGRVLERDKEDKPILISGTSMDITDRKKAQTELNKIKWLLSQKPAEIEMEKLEKPFYGDLTKLNTNKTILDAVGKENLNEIVKDYLNLLDTSIAIYEKNGDYAVGIFSSSWCKTLDSASRKLCKTDNNKKALNSGKWLCHESCWTEISKKAIESGTIQDKPCNGGINIYAVPIFAFGQTVGAINFGYGNPPTDEKSLVTLADRYQIEKNKLSKLARAYKTRPYFIINVAKKRLKTSAKLIGEIVERKKTEDKLERAEKVAKFGYWEFDLNQKTVHTSEGAKRIYGLSSRENTISEIQKYPLPKYRKMLNNALKRLVAEKEPYNVYFKIKRPTDNKIIDINSVAVYDLDTNKVFGIIKDITERKKIEEMLKLSETKYRTIIENMQDVYYRTDLEGNILMMSPSALEIFGYDKMSKLMSQNIQNLYYQREDREKFIKILKKNQSVYNFEETLKKKDGTPINALVSSQYFKDKNNKIKGIEGIITDFTQQKELQEKLNQAQRMESIGQLAAGISHDFNNLLTVINGYSELLVDELQVSDEEMEMIKSISSAGAKAQKLTNQLLLFSRKRIGRPERINLNDIIKKSQKMLRRLIAENIEIKYDLEPNLPLVSLDANQLDQIIINMSVNAKDAMPKGGVLRIATETVEFDDSYLRTHPLVEKSGEYVKLSISDTGIGMDKETQKKIFEPFYTTKGLGKGTGLGLATVYGIVKQNKGYISVYSEPGEGTTFNLYFMKVENKNKKEIQKNEKLSKIQTEKTVLVVEDEDFVRKYILKILDRAGYKTINSSTPKEALNIFQEKYNYIDLLVTDVIMPEMNGKELYKELIKIKPDLKVIYMSGYPADVISKHDIIHKNTNFIQKPVERKKFLKLLNKIFQ